MANMKVLIIAGGTGGHIFPGITIGQALIQHNIEVCWLGSKNGMETILVPEAGFCIDTVNITAFRKKRFLKKTFVLYNLFQSIYQACQIIHKRKPDIILAMGGFVSAPGGIAAKLMRKPLYVHEQNSIAGLTNTILAKIANAVFCAFPDSFPEVMRKKNPEKFILTGNPVREIIQKTKPKQQLHTPPRILVLGGSRGAKILNDIVPMAMDLLPEDLLPDIYHQSGEHTVLSYSEKMIQNRRVTVLPFIQNMAEIYTWADIIICRAGALTLSEICATGIPAVLIPYPYAVDDHQTKNASYLTKNQAAILIPQALLTPEKLAQVLIKLFSDQNYYINMANHSYLLHSAHATQKILEILLAKLKTQTTIKRE